MAQKLVNELDPIDRPDLFDEGAWETLTPGERVRTLRYAEDQVALPAETYRALRRLPTWAFYGPEHGLPREFFNRGGFLLPRYRPGGAKHEDFEAWRRDHRLRRWIADRLLERWRIRWRAWGPWMALLGVFALLGVGALMRWWLGGRVGEDAATPWMFAVWAGLWIVAGLVLLALRHWLIPRLGGALVDRIVRQRAAGRGGRR